MSDTMYNDNPTNCEYIPYEVVPLGNLVKINIKHGLDSIESFQEVISLIQNTGPTDKIEVYLETPGGSVALGLQIINALNRSSAEKHLYVDGQVASMGVDIALGVNFSQYYINPLSSWLIHDGSFFCGGKVTDVEGRLNHERILSKKLFDEFYYGILTDEEIDHLCIGKGEMFLLGSDMIERLNSRLEKFREDDPEYLTYEQLMKMQKKDILGYFGVAPESVSSEESSEKDLT